MRQFTYADVLAAQRELCSRHLVDFVRLAWPVLEPEARYVHNWHVDAICEHLEAVTSGQINRLLINVPPGSMKSLLASVMWPAWEWGAKNRPTLRYINTAFNEKPVTRDTRKCRDLILSKWYQQLWSHIKLTRTGETSFANSRTGVREGVPFQSLTSQRGDRLIIDDPHSTETAESDTERQNTTRRFREGAINRLNDQEKSAIVVIMQRLHSEDISGLILARDMGYEHLCLPMEYEHGRNKTTVIGFSDPRTIDGELLDPVRFPPATVAQLKSDMGSYGFAGQYQQRPAPREGGLFKRHWFKIVPVVPHTTTRCRAWDYAGTVKKSGNNPDFTVGLRMAKAGSNYYIETVKRFQDTPGVVSQTIHSFAKTDPHGTTIRLPKDPGQAGIMQAEAHVKMLAGYDVKVEPISGDKETRARPLAAQAEAGNVYLLEGEWNEQYLDEMCTFPMGSHDDLVDATADAFNELALRGGYDWAAFD